MIRIKELLSLSRDIYKSNFGVYLTLSIIALVPFTAAGFLKNANPYFYLGSAVISFVLLISAQLGMYYTVKHRDEFLGVKPALIFGFKRIPSYLWISTLSGLASILAYILFFIPGLIATASFAFGSAVLVDEDLYGSGALLKSRFYAKGHILGILLRLLVLGLVIGLVSGLGTYLFDQVNHYAGMVFQLFITVLALPFSTIYMFEMYRNLKFIKPSEPAFNPTVVRKAMIISAAVLGTLVFLGVLLLAALLTHPPSALPTKIPLTGYNK